MRISTKMDVDAGFSTMVLLQQFIARLKRSHCLVQISTAAAFFDNIGHIQI